MLILTFHFTNLGRLCTDQHFQYGNFNIGNVYPLSSSCSQQELRFQSKRGNTILGWS